MIVVICIAIALWLLADVLFVAWVAWLRSTTRARRHARRTRPGYIHPTTQKDRSA
jgi:hypothetical protein